MPIPTSNNRPNQNSSRNPQMPRKPVTRNNSNNNPGYQRKQSERVTNPYDSDEDNVFFDDSNSYSRPGLNNPSSNYPDDDNAYFEDYDDYDDDIDDMSDEEYEEYEKKVKQQEAYDRNDVDQSLVEREVKTKRGRKNKTSKNKKDTTGRDVFVDEKELKVKPFGKRKLKVNDFDERKNKQKTAKIVSTGIIILLVGLVGLGVKNAVVPPKVYTEEEISAISLNSIGYNNFPEERGKSFVEDFMKAYLTLGTDADVSNALSYFYTGVVSDPSRSVDNGVISHTPSSNLTVNGFYQQKVVIDPKVYNSLIINDNAASYSVRSLVQPNTNVAPNERGDLPPLEGALPYWISFNVNVYYDSEKDIMYISQDSPSIIPNEDVGAASDIPKSQPLGNGIKTEEQTVSQITPVINGFVQGYAKSSSTNISSIEQYLSPTATSDTKDGLNDEFVLAGSPTNAIKIQSFNTNNPNELKVLVMVDWLKNITLRGSTESLASTVNNSQYVATLVKNGDKWEVDKFDAVKYVPEVKEKQQ